MAAGFRQPDTGGIYIRPNDGLPFFIVVQVSERRWAVAQFESNANKSYATSFVVVSEPMTWQDAHAKCAELTADKHESIAPHWHNPAR